MFQNTEQHIAIIGIAGRFPGARDINSFWSNIIAGKESITYFSDAELLAAGEHPTNIANENYVRARGIVDDVSDFDAEFFSISALEATILDPQQRVFLECAWECFEDAGQIPDEYPDRIGVFAACGLSYYLINNLLPNAEFLQNANYYQLLLGNDKDFIATRVAYKLNLRGPAITISCGCSSSLAAVHYACQSLLNGECEMALAGGVSISIPQAQGYLYKKDMIGSPDGHCYAFDKRAEGTVKSNGAGIVLLKPLADALADNDQIYSIIRGSAINNDGDLKVGYTAPSVDQQALVIAEALAIADVDANSIQYIESHGTGTQLGDPIEIKALTKAYKDYGVRAQSCAIASLKSNFGHLDAAAGVAGLIKICLAMKHSIMPPSINYQTPNPKIQFEQTPFYVLTQAIPWLQPKNHPKRAALSSFGIGGTNIHLILEAAPIVQNTQTTMKLPQLFCLSAKNKAALLAYQKKLCAALGDEPQLSIDDVAYSLDFGRKQFPYRSFHVASSKKDLIDALAASISVISTKNNLIANLVFMFSGQGSQYSNMGLGLYQANPRFRHTIDQCLNDLELHSKLNLRSVLFASNNNDDLIHQTEYTQAALFIIEYALADLLMFWGLQPKALIGHSIGEYVAAVISGIMTLEDALKIVAKRGRIIQQLPKGSMLAVFAPFDQIKSKVPAPISLALVNSPMNYVFSGETDKIEQLQLQFKQDNIQSQILQTSHAFHSYMLEPVLDDFKNYLDNFKFKSPSLPIVSNVTGTWLTTEQAQDPRYWVQQLRKTVLFSQGIEYLRQQIKPVFLEIGPGNTLATLTKQHGIEHVLHSMRHRHQDKDDLVVLYNVIGQLWQQGFNINTKNFYRNKPGQKISLPTYAWQRQRYWVSSDRHISVSPNRTTEDIKLNNIQSYDDIVAALSNAWQKALGRKADDIDCNFFQAGGDSFVAVNFIDFLQADLKKRLSVVDIFQFPTIRQLTDFFLRSNDENDLSWALESASLEIESYDKGEEL